MLPQAKLKKIYTLEKLKYYDYKTLLHLFNTHFKAHNAEGSRKLIKYKDNTAQYRLHWSHNENLAKDKMKDAIIKILDVYYREKEKSLK